MIKESDKHNTKAECRVSGCSLNSLWSYSCPYLITILLVALATVFSFLLSPYLPHGGLMIYILVVAIVATRFGLAPSLLCWLLSVISYQYFIVPPRFSFEIADERYLFSFLVVLILAFVMGRRTALIKRYASHLENLVTEKTADLVKVNHSLAAEIEQHKVTEVHLQQVVKELTKANSALESFAKLASHDLREPLRGIRGFVDIIQQRYGSTLTVEIMEFMSHIQDCVDRMDKLIQGLITCAQIEAADNQFAECDLREIAKEAIANLSVSIAESKCTITLDSLPTLKVDRFQLVHVFQNLIANAIKFRSDRPLEIRIGVEKDETQHVIFVSDNGIGIDNKYLRQLFKMFQRLHSAGKYPGSGLGLAMCKTIVENHGGKIWVESEPDAGSTFKFTLLQNSQKRENIAANPDSNIEFIASSR